MAVKVLAWNKTIDDAFILTNEGPKPITARRGQISSAHNVLLSSGVQILFEEASTDSSQPLFEPALRVAFPPNIGTEALLLLAESDGELRGNLVPFSEDEVAYNTLNIFNFTGYPVAAEIDADRHSIPPRNRLSIPYRYESMEKEALKTRFAVQTEEGWDLVQNGFVPIIPEGRILFFISEDMANPTSRRLRPVRFTYVFEVQASEESRRQRDGLNIVDPNETYEPAPF